MAVTTINDVIGKAEIILQDTTNVRWKKEELIGWLNDAYKQVVLLRPDSSTETKTVRLAGGTKQSFGDLSIVTESNGTQTVGSGTLANGIRLINVHRNHNLELSVMSAIRFIQREILDDQLPDWHSETASNKVKHFVFTPETPKTFYVYPPAVANTTFVELSVAVVPSGHTPSDLDIGTNTIGLDDTYAPALVDYIIYRAYLKDADYAANDNRAAQAYNVFIGNLGANAPQTAPQ